MKFGLPRWVLGTVGVIGIVNFVVFVAVAIAIGGDAANGRTSDGRYFVGEHGCYTQVTKPVFMYSWWHAYSLLITQPAAMIAGAMLRRQKRKALN